MSSERDALGDDREMLRERIDLLTTKDRQWGEIIEQLRVLQVVSAGSRDVVRSRASALNAGWR